jgi:hypothetical protein
MSVECEFCSEHAVDCKCYRDDMTWQQAALLLGEELFSGVEKDYHDLTPSMWLVTCLARWNELSQPTYTLSSQAEFDADIFKLGKICLDSLEDRYGK